ncbi:hypothetical protein [Enhygromyxa salina]|nr:hypothetical protein [Enhygromyxa salina]
MSRVSCLSVPGLFLLLACAPATGGAGGDEGTESDEGECVGQADCACTPGGGCDPGLVCEAEMCVPEGGEADDDTGESDGDTGDGDPACTENGCMCDGSPGSCDPELVCDEGICSPNLCGNAVADDGEACDDGNEVDGDGCDTDCTFTTLEVFGGGLHTCALIEGGRVRCWGEGMFGTLGHGNTEDIGDDETPASAGDVALPGSVVSLAAGGVHNCAQFDDDWLRCWGSNIYGQLGNAADSDLGDDETLEMLPGIAIVEAVSQFESGSFHNCARLVTGDARCWGANAVGQLGVGDTTTIGDNEPPSAGELVFDGTDGIERVAAGVWHNCALTVSDELICWGRNISGQLGYGNSQSLGDDEPPSDAGPVDVRPGALPNDASISAVALGGGHSCVLFSTGEVLCWGGNEDGELGQGHTDDWGDDNDELPSALPLIDLGGVATAISAGEEHTCALLDDGSVRCWGKNDFGQLGLGHLDNIGDDEAPADAEAVDLGGLAISISAGGDHTCAVLADYSVVCWGNGAAGRLGYGNVDNIGDDESPSAAGFVEVL